MTEIFAVWKPVGPTSNDVLNQIRKIAGTRHVGHAGTLDPLAEGVLVVGIGREATKKLKDAVGAEKEYIADVYLGATSTTDDEEGTKKHSHILENVRMSVIENVIKEFVGKIQQTPPIYSALKIKGRPAYKYARGGETLEMKPREVEIKSIEIIKYEWPHLALKVITGPGVYIRALARDLGERLGCGAYLSGLVRTRIGLFTKGKVITLQDLKNEFHR